ncbi:MAG TPA: rhombosortase [Hyphomicrobiales bacterium]|nr:rhombosortase [Hyphomicrobiales bacterium]
MIFVAFLAEIFGDWSRLWLSYDRDGIAAGQAWRLLTGHFVHLSPSHLLLNAAGLLLVWLLVGGSASTARWLLLAAGSIFGIDAGLWVLAPRLDWYVGLSGLLHGLLAAGIVAELRGGRRDTWILAGLVLGKLTYEQFSGPLPGSEASAGGTVIVEAHLFGAICGALTAVFLPVSPRHGSI